MPRIAQHDLQARVNRINRTLGLPEDPYQAERGPNGELQGNPGTFKMDGAYGGWALNRMARDGGTGESCVLTRGSARDLYDRMGAFLDGIDAARGAK
jgi:hypothetical protein